MQFPVCDLFLTIVQVKDYANLFLRHIVWLTDVAELNRLSHYFHGVMFHYRIFTCNPLDDTIV